LQSYRGPAGTHLQPRGSDQTSLFPTNSNDTNDMGSCSQSNPKKYSANSKDVYEDNTSQVDSPNDDKILTHKEKSLKNPNNPDSSGSNPQILNPELPESREGSMSINSESQKSSIDMNVAVLEHESSTYKGSKLSALAKSKARDDKNYQGEKVYLGANGMPILIKPDTNLINDSNLSLDGKAQVGRKVRSTMPIHGLQANLSEWHKARSINKQGLDKKES
jgi:hypothetical protein